MTPEELAEVLDAGLAGAKELIPSQPGLMIQFALECMRDKALEIAAKPGRRTGTEYL